MAGAARSAGGVLRLFGLVVAAVSVSGSARASGVLIPTNGMPAIAVESMRVEAVVEDGLARTAVRQTFVNPHGRALEAIYQFPVPEGAALTGLVLETGEQRLEGFLAERKTARRAYDSLVRRNIDPALLEQVRRGVFQLSVFPVLPDVPTTVELSWIEQVPLTQNRYRYVFPQQLLGAPAIATSKTERDFVFSFELRSPVSIVEATSPVPDLSFATLRERSVFASLERSSAQLNDDIEITVRVETPAPSLQVRTFRDGDRAPYFAALLTPPPLTSEQRVPLDVTLVLDTSGSMQGGKWEQVRSAALWFLEQLRPEDRVNVLLFESHVRQSADTPEPATPKRLATLARFVERVEPGGGTALGDAVLAACGGARTAGRSVQVVVLTDGMPTIGEVERPKIVALAGQGAGRGLRLHTFGVGADADGTLLEALALAGNGQCEMIPHEGELQARLVRFLARIAAPAISDVELWIDGRRADGRLAGRANEVFLGEQAVLTGRWDAEGVLEVSVHGICDGERFELCQDVDFGVPADPNRARDRVARDLAATAELQMLARAHRLRSTADEATYYAAVREGDYSTEEELTAAMIELSLDSGIQCPFTAFFALLPEDHARLDPRDAAALEEAMERARKSGRRLAGVDDDSGESGEAWDVAPVVEEEEARLPLDAPFDARSRVDVIGTGGGAGGASGGKYGRRGGKRGGAASQKAVETGQNWVVARQRADGSWSGDTGALTTDDVPAWVPADDVGATSAMLLALLGAGHTEATGRFSDPLKAGLRFLASCQDASTGRFNETSGGHCRLVSQALATLTLCEAAWAGGSPLLRTRAAAAVRAVTADVEALLTGEGDAAAGSGDEIDGERGLVLAGQLFALLAARDAGVEEDPALFDRAFVRLTLLERELGEQTDGELAGPGAAGPDQGPVSIARTLSAAVLLLRILSAESLDPNEPLPVVEQLRKRLPRPTDLQHSLSALYLYYGSYAMWQIGGRPWNDWQKAMLTSVVNGQGSDGAWPVWNDGGGEVVSTAFAVLVLEVYYRYDKLLGSR